MCGGHRLRRHPGRRHATPAQHGLGRRSSIGRPPCAAAGRLPALAGGEGGQSGRGERLGGPCGVRVATHRCCNACRCLGGIPPRRPCLDASVSTRRRPPGILLQSTTAAPKHSPAALSQAELSRRGGDPERRGRGPGGIGAAKEEGGGSDRHGGAEPVGAGLRRTPGPHKPPSNAALVLMRRGVLWWLWYSSTRQYQHQYEQSTRSASGVCE